MNIREIINYAKDNGFNSVMFEIQRNDQHIAYGRFLDAYSELIIIPCIGNGTGFVRMKELEEHIGYEITFEVVEDVDKWRTGVCYDFVIRGIEMPEKYKIAQ